MSASAIDIIIFAPLAPLFGAALFWFIQLLFIESQKYMLRGIKRNHEPFCKFTNFIGVLFQTICHALGYTITKHGISSFYVSVHYGKVSPKRKKKGIFEWLSNSFLFLGPFFIPPFLLFLCLIFLIDDGFVFNSINSYSFSENLIIFGSNLHHFSLKFFNFLFTIDLLHPGHVVFFILFIVLGLGIRPSYIGENTKRKVDIFYDLKNIRDEFLHKPIYLVLFLLSAYIFSYLSVLLGLKWYVGIFSFFGWLSIIAISALLVAHGIILLIKVSDLLPGIYHYISMILLPLSYLILRALFFIFPIPLIPTISLIISICITVCIIILFLHRLTNTFKLNEAIKSPKKSK